MNRFIIDRTTDPRKVVIWILRIGVAFTFLGHGAFAFGVRTSWIPYLTTVGFSVSASMFLMPIIGVIDFTIALMTLFYPQRWLLLYAVFWTMATALIRPFAGEAWWEFFERGANWAASLALLILLIMNRRGIVNESEENN